MRLRNLRARAAHTRRIALLASFAVALAAAPVAAAELCQQWSTPTILGQLDTQVFPEASGIAVSGDGERLYHHNDGSRPRFLVTQRDGSAARTVTVSGFMPSDIEDLARGPCGERTCLYLADVGDNTERRPFVQIAVIEEAAAFGAAVEPLRVIIARYPDGPHNAEAVAIHPSGELLLVTKADRRTAQDAPALVFRLKRAQLATGGEQTFDAVGALGLPALNGPLRVVTGMDIAPDGRRFVLLTYGALVEVAVDLTGPLPGAADWVEGKTHRVAGIAAVIGAEAIAYDQDGRSVIYTTESVRGLAAPVIRQPCAG